MVVTTTAVAFISLSLGLTVCGVWFLKAFRRAGGAREDRRVGFLLSLLFLGFGFQNGIMGLGTLLFARNSGMLYFVLIVSHVLLAIVALLGVYTAYYIFSPRMSPYLGLVLTGVIGVSSVATTIITHPNPFISPQSGIEWGMNFSLSLLIFYTLFISIGSTLYIFIRLFFITKTREVKNFSLILSALAAVGIILAFVRLVLLYNADIAVRTRIYDLGIIGVGTAFIIALLVVPIVKNLVQHRL